MRTPFVTAAIAATATATDAKIPEFVAGMIFGLTGDNHLEEIKQCYKEGKADEKGV